MNKITGGVGGKFTLVWGCIWIFVTVLLAVATHSLAAQEVKKWQPKHAFSASPVFQRDDPVYQQVEPFIYRSAAQDGTLGTVDIDTYDRWLNQNRGIDVRH